MLAGGNPYGHGFAESVPPGAPFAYGPLALLWYLPSLDRPGMMELAGLVRGARPAGPARSAPGPGRLRGDPGLRGGRHGRLQRHHGGPAAPRGPARGAALADRRVRCCWPSPRPSSPTPWPGCPGSSPTPAPSARWWPSWWRRPWPGCRPWWRGVPSRCSGPSVGPTRSTPSRTTRWPTAWAARSPCPRPPGRPLRVGAGVLLAVLSLRLVRSAASFVIVGALVFGATLFLGFWSTFAYLAAVAPVICWHLDDWLGTRGAARGLAGRPGACCHQLGRSTLASSRIRAIDRLRRQRGYGR